MKEYFGIRGLLSTDISYLETVAFAKFLPISGILESGGNVMCLVFGLGLGLLVSLSWSLGLGLLSLAWPVQRDRGKRKRPKNRGDAHKT